MTDDIKRGLINRLVQVGAFDARVADPRIGFEYALPGMHPLEIWPECRSIVVIAVATPPEGNNTYIGTYAPWAGPRNIGPVPEMFRSEERAVDRLARLQFDALAYRGMAYLDEHGCRVSFRKPRLKLAAYEAGLGVYGKSGVILNPVLGNRMRLTAIMTDAELEPDGRLEGYNPCEGCDLCIRMCPAKAYDPTKRYPDSWSREACMAKRAEIAAKGYYCHNCWAVCPAGTLDDDALLSVDRAQSFCAPHRRAAQT